MLDLVHLEGVGFINTVVHSDQRRRVDVDYEENSVGVIISSPAILIFWEMLVQLEVVIEAATPSPTATLCIESDVIVPLVSTGPALGLHCHAHHDFFCPFEHDYCMSTIL
ncbi:MAG: hypothetical protein ACI8RD_002227 [Bacillariaceae sp.]|jgi:hypothetical protein